MTTDQQKALAYHLAWMIKKDSRYNGTMYDAANRIIEVAKCSDYTRTELLKAAYDEFFKPKESTHA